MLLSEALLKHWQSPDSDVTSKLAQMVWEVLEVGPNSTNMDAQMLFLCTHFPSCNHTVASGSIYDQPAAIVPANYSSRQLSSEPFNVNCCLLIDNCGIELIY